MNKFFNNLPFRRYLKWKISFCFVLILVSFLLFTVTLSGFVLSIYATGSTGKNMRNEAALIATQLDTRLQYVKYNIQVFSISSMLQDTLRSVYEEQPVFNANLRNRMHAAISTVFDIEEIVGDMRLVTPDGIEFQFPDNTIIQDLTLTQAEEYLGPVSRGGRISISENIQQAGFAEPSNLTVDKSIVDVYTGQLLGVFSAAVKESTFSSVYKDIYLEDDEWIFVVNSNGTIVSHPDKDLLFTPFVDSDRFSALLKSDNVVHFEYLEKPSLVLLEPLTGIDWYVVRIVPKSQVYAQYRRFVFIIALSGTIFIAITILVSFMLSRRITSPLSKLVSLTKKISAGDFDVEILTDSIDEIYDLTTHFNLMVKNIKKLTYDIWVEQRKKREYELSFLQAQINPHLLYNSLSSIRQLLEKDDPLFKRRASMALESLGMYYKKVLRLTASAVTIQEEIDLTKHYLDLQSQIRPDSFQYSIHLEEEILSCRILKLSLQPLVENSVLHGFGGYDNDNRIEIHGWMKKDSVVLEIRDNGRGIAKGHAPSTTQQHNGYSTIGNIDGRIKLRFGEEYGISIHSVEGEGTTVTMLLPCMV